MRACAYAYRGITKINTFLSTQLNLALLCRDISFEIRQYVNKTCTFRMKYTQKVIGHAQVQMLPETVTVCDCDDTITHSEDGGEKLVLAASDFDWYMPTKISQVIIS